MKTKKIISITMAALLCGSMAVTATGCGGFANDDNALEVYACSQGRGHAWLEKALEEFGKKAAVKEKYPNYQFRLYTNDEYSWGQDQVLSGGTNYDLMLISTYSASTAEQKMNGTQHYLENMNGVLSSKIPDYNNGGYEKNAAGEEWTYFEKLAAFNPNFAENLVMYDAEGNEQYWVLPSMGTSKYGIIYNKTYVDGYGYKDETTGETILPRTSDELLAFAQSMTKKKDSNGNAVVPFVYSSETMYWPQVYRTMWAQYDGVDAFANYFRGYWLNESGEYELNVKVLETPGRWKAMQALEDLIAYPTGLIHNECAALDFTMAQSYLIAGKGMMQANGDWVSHEMKSMEGQAGADSEIRMMDDVIISDLAKDKLQSVETDEEFSAVIGAIRAGLTSLTGSYKVPDYSGATATWKTVEYNVTQSDYNRIVEASKVYSEGSHFAPTVIPSYATAKNLAKDFVLYLASDECAKYYVEATGGAMPNVYYDIETEMADVYDNFYPLAKDALRQVKNRTPIFMPGTSGVPLMYRAGFSQTAIFPEIEFAMKAGVGSERMTTQRYKQELLDKYTKNNNYEWSLMLEMAGLA